MQPLNLRQQMDQYPSGAPVIQLGALVLLSARPVQLHIGLQKT
jgi:hypothetical protein